MFGCCAVRLGWSPDVFWPATPHDTYAALRAWRLANDRDFATRQKWKAETAEFPD